MTKTLLLGFHDEATSHLYKRGAPSEYAIVQETTLAGVETRLEGGDITAIVMDLNLGEPASENIGPAQQIYRLVKDTDVRYMGLSGRKSTVDAALAAGIPANHKDDFDPLGEAYREFLN